MACPRTASKRPRRRPVRPPSPPPLLPPSPRGIEGDNSPPSLYPPFPRPPPHFFGTGHAGALPVSRTGPAPRRHRDMPRPPPPPHVPGHHVGDLHCAGLRLGAVVAASPAQEPPPCPGRRGTGGGGVLGAACLTGVGHAPIPIPQTPSATAGPGAAQNGPGHPPTTPRTEAANPRRYNSQSPGTAVNGLPPPSLSPICHMPKANAVPLPLTCPPLGGPHPLSPFPPAHIPTKGVRAAPPPAPAPLCRPWPWRRCRWSRRAPGTTPAVAAAAGPWGRCWGPRPPTWGPAAMSLPPRHRLRGRGRGRGRYVAVPAPLPPPPPRAPSVDPVNMTSAASFSMRLLPPILPPPRTSFEWGGGGGAEVCVPKIA